jgi:hypothetical protein
VIFLIFFSTSLFQSCECVTTSVASHNIPCNALKNKNPNKLLPEPQVKLTSFTGLVDNVRIQNCYVLWEQLFHLYFGWSGHSEDDP